MVKEILKFSAEWCQPCKMYAPIFHNVSENDEYKDITFKEIDVEDDEELAAKYQIRSVPTTVLLDENNEVITKVSGAIPLTSLTSIINEHMNG